MKQLEQTLVGIYNAQHQRGDLPNGPVHQPIRHRLYLRHLSSRSATANRGDHFSSIETDKCEDNNNFQTDERTAASSTSAISEFGVAKFSTSSGSVSHTTAAVQLGNGHPPTVPPNRDEKPRRQTSPLLSGCRRKLYLHFNKALGGSKPRWTSPPVDGQTKSRRHPFLRRRKSANSGGGASSDIEERPSSLSGPSEDGLQTPPALLRSPSAGQIDYSDLVPLNLYLEKDRDDEHRMIAYNSSRLIGAPSQQPYQIEAAESVNGGIGSSSGADSIVTENGHFPINASVVAAQVEDRRFGSSVANNGDISGDEQPKTADSAFASLAGRPDSQTEAACTSVTAASIPAKQGGFQKTQNRMCTSFRIKVPEMKNPVDACLLADDHTAVADYDNGLLVLNALGDLVQHRKSPAELNACGVACTRSSLRLLLLVVRDGIWSVNIYNSSYCLLETARCPSDGQIENWALRRLVVSSENRLHLLASGETKSCIWSYELDGRDWRTVLVENGGRKTTGSYNDMSVRKNGAEETRILLCEWKKAQLWMLTVNEKTNGVDQRSIKMKRVKGQEWIVQGPHLAVLDDQTDIVVYDGSGKLFLFDGDTYKCKKIIADVGRGEVSALAVRDGWVYVLCRHRLCIEGYLYREHTETNL